MLEDVSLLKLGHRNVPCEVRFFTKSQRCMFWCFFTLRLSMMYLKFISLLLPVRFRISDILARVTKAVDDAMKTMDEDGDDLVSKLEFQHFLERGESVWYY